MLIMNGQKKCLRYSSFSVIFFSLKLQKSVNLPEEMVFLRAIPFEILSGGRWKQRM